MATRSPAVVQTGRNDFKAAKPEETNDETRAEIESRHTEVIRTFRSDPKLNVMYVATAQNPWIDRRDIDIYNDQNNFEYWIDPELNSLVQFGPRAGLPPAPVAQHGDVKLPVGELRDRAVAIITSQVPDFAERRCELLPFEDNRRNVIFFFRFEETGVHEFDLPPFIQVAMYADGTLACFTNTLEK